MGVLRQDLLENRTVALGQAVSDELSAALRDLGARVAVMPDLGDPADDQVGEWARTHGPLSVLVYDAGPALGAGDLQALMATMQGAWVAVREVAVGALIESPDPGKIILIGPAARSGDHAEAACAALENLARTLSVEWARHNITAVMVAPGPECSAGELAEVIGYLCSRGGEYFSGCRLEVGLGGR
jgi:NAD(P)-dependent dehydrogenase (short-subunit alcohol dehydrogenase family)